MAFDCLKKLHRDELYSNVIHLGQLLLTIVERKNNVLTPHQHYQTTVYFADALYHLGQYRKAGQTYMKALTFLKNRISLQSPPPSTGRNRSSHHQNNDWTPENEVKFRLHHCLVKQGKLKEAIGVLDSIPKTARVPKVFAALGDLHRKLNLVQQAKTCYKDLLASSPYAIDAAVELLQLGVHTDELIQICGMVDMDQWKSMFEGDQWFESWMLGHFNYAKRDYMSAAAVFRDLDSKSMLANNPRLLFQLAKSYYNAGEYQRAISVFQRVHSLDPLFLKGMDILASLLADEKSRLKELESLATQLMSISPDSPVSWVAMGYLCKAMKKYPKALYFAHKACGDAQTAYVEAMLLKGGVLLDSKKWSEGAIHFHEALITNPYRFELYEGLVSCHLEQHKMKEARIAAGYCIKQIGQNARTITLYASVLSRDPSTINDAQTILEKAVTAAPFLLKAVYLLVEIYDKQGQYDRAIELLRRQTSTHVKNRIHRLLGDFLSKADRPAEAMDSYRFALTLEPGDAQAEKGLDELGERLRVDPNLLCPDLYDGSSAKTPSDSPESPLYIPTPLESTTATSLHVPEASTSNSITPVGQPSSTFTNQLINAPARRAGGASTSNGSISSFAPPRLVVSLDASAMTPLTDNDADPTTSADAAMDEFGDDDDVLSGQDNTSPFGDDRSDVY